MYVQYISYVNMKYVPYVQYLWQFCDRDLFGDGEQVILSNAVGDVQLEDQMVIA